MASGSASVKAVLSGDTVVLVGKAVGNGPPQEITITLASLQAPRISRGPQQTTEDQFAWESREFLRKLCIGKTVTFKIVYCVASINRTFGDIYFQNVGDDSSEPVCLSELVVEAGWSPVKGADGGDKLSSRHEKLIALEAAAKESKRGVHGSKGVGRTISWAPTSSEVEDIYNKHKGVPTSVIVEYVRDGASLRVLLLESMTYISFSLAGIICPRINSGKSQSSGESDDQKQSSSGSKPEPFALQARHFTELRLLNREVEIVMQTLDRTGNVLGSVLHPKGNIAVEMVKNGLAKVTDRSLAALGKETVFSLRMAEKEAQTSQRFIWTGYQPAARSACVRYFEGVVIEIVSGDTVIVVEGDEGGEGIERKITLSSIKVPRMGNIRGEGMEAWATESRDLLRARVIGRKVGVAVEYEKIQASPSQPSNLQKRVFATVKVLTGKESEGQGRNVALMLVTEGVATCVRHREGEERSCEYDSYLMSEAETAAKGKGLHGDQPAPDHSHSKVEDLTMGTDSKKAKAFITLMLQRASTGGSSSGVTLKGTVEFVYSGSRVKVLLPNEGCVIQLTLSQIRCPLPSRGASATAGAARAGEPFADEAKRFTRRHLLQREVSVCIDDVDKNGVALGRIYLSAPDKLGKGGKSPYALTLVSNGLARVDTRHAAEKPSSEISDLQEAQRNALDGEMAMWSIADTVNEEQNRQSGGDRRQQADEIPDEDDNEELDISRLAVSNGGPKVKGPSLRGDEERVVVRMCEITNGVSFFVHVVNENRQKQLKAIELQMTSFALSHPKEEGVTEVEVKKGQLVLALFDDRSGSGPVWFRAKVEDISGKKARVQFIDYGNKAVVNMTTAEIAAVDSASSSSSASKNGGGVYFSVAPLAIECSLAFLSAPSEAEDQDGSGLIQAAGLSLGDLTWDRELSMQVFGSERESGRLLVALYDDRVKEVVEKDGAEVDDKEEDKGDEIKEKISENVFDGEGEESRARRAAISESQRVLSVNELILMDGLARVSRSASRLVPRSGGGGRGGGRGDKRGLPPMSPLATNLLSHLEEAMKYARRAHTNLYRYGDPADSDEERENDREKEREKKDRDQKAK